MVEVFAVHVPVRREIISLCRATEQAGGDILHTIGVCSSGPLTKSPVLSCFVLHSTYVMYPLVGVPTYVVFEESSYSLMIADKPKIAQGSHSLAALGAEYSPISFLTVVLRRYRWLRFQPPSLASCALSVFGAISCRTNDGRRSMSASFTRSTPEGVRAFMVAVGACHWTSRRAGTAEAVNPSISSSPCPLTWNFIEAPASSSPSANASRSCDGGSSRRGRLRERDR